MRNVETGEVSEYKEKLSKDFDIPDGTVSVVDFCGDSEVSMIKEGHDGFVFLENPSKLMSQWCERDGVDVILPFVDAANRRAVVFVREMNVHKWHVVQPSLGLYAPWCFDAEKLTTDEMKLLLMPLADDRSGETRYKEYLEKAAVRYEPQMQAEKKRTLLTGFENRARERQIESAREQYDTAVRCIRQYQEELMKQYDKKALASALLDSLSGAESDTHELMDYFVSNSGLYIDRVDRDSIWYYARVFLSNWDIDNYVNVSNDPFSELICTYDRDDRDITESQYRQLLDAIFKEETVRVMVYSRWQMSFGGGVAPDNDCTPPTYISQDALPNPHLVYYHCRGTWRQELDSASERGDFVFAADITSAETGNVNFGDSTVMNRFAKDLLTTDKRCFTLPDGTNVTRKEAIAWLESERKEG